MRAIITSDSGSCANWYARDLKIRRGMMASLSGGLASMGAAVPYAIAAKYAQPDRPVIALVGDGAMQMNNMAELITVAKYWREWKDPRWIVCVFNNEDLNQVTWEQRVINGDPKFDASQHIPERPLSRFAEMIGLQGIYVDSPDLLGSAWDEALAADSRSCWKSKPIRRYPRCHLISRSIRRATSCARSWKAIRKRVASSSIRQSRSWLPFCQERGKAENNDDRASCGPSNHAPDSGPPSCSPASSLLARPSPTRSRLNTCSPRTPLRFTMSTTPRRSTRHPGRVAMTGIVPPGRVSKSTRPSGGTGRLFSRVASE